MPKKFGISAITWGYAWGHIMSLAIVAMSLSELNFWIWFLPLALVGGVMLTVLEYWLIKTNHMEERSDV